MKTNFNDALKQVLIHEGGWADHPQDPGGATMKGVTLATYRRYFGNDKTKDDLRSISDAELEHIYRSGYWDKCHCDDLPAGVDYAVFDAAVNSGPARSARWLQAAVGTGQDGSIGPVTLAKVEQHEPADVTNDMCDQRLDFLRSLTTWPTFGAGWERRVAGVRNIAVAMARGDTASTGHGDDQAVVPDVDFEIVRKGSSGSWVRKLQQALDISVDGTFGNQTEQALIAWQQAHGLEADGIAGRNTYRSLGLVA